MPWADGVACHVSGDNVVDFLFLPAGSRLSCLHSGFAPALMAPLICGLDGGPNLIVWIAARIVQRSVRQNANI
jgi:hypothetical protein